MNAIETHGIVFKNGPAILLARVTSATGANLVQSDISSIVYSVYQLDDDHPDVENVVTGHDNASLVVANVIFNTLQTDVLWDVDATGYNFKHILAIATNQAFPSAGPSFRVTHKLTPASGQIILVRFRLHAI